MDVIELLNSSILFPQIWEKYTLFSEVDERVVIAYNNALEDLEFEDPNTIFDKHVNKKYKQTFDKNILTKAQKRLNKRRYKLK